MNMGAAEYATRVAKYLPAYAATAAIYVSLVAAMHAALAVLRSNLRRT